MLESRISSLVAVEPSPAPALERPVEDAAARLLAQPDEEADVVNRDQPEREHILDHEEMAEVAARERRAGLAIARRVERLLRALERRALHVHPAGRQPGGAVAPVARGGHAVKQIHAPRDSVEQSRGKPDPHKITG